MKTTPAVERFIYALVALLSLAALWLVWNAPASYLDARPVYQGF